MTPEERYKTEKAAENYYRWARFFGEIPVQRGSKESLKAECKRINAECDAIRERGD